MNFKYIFSEIISFLVISCWIPSAMVLIFDCTKLFQASLLYSPTPKRNGGTPIIAATVLLSSCTVSSMARSLSDKGLTCSTWNCSAGISQGSPISDDFTYSSRSLCRPEGLANSSTRASTFTMIEGFHFDSMNPFSVAAACLRFCATSRRQVVTPLPFQRYVLSGLKTKCRRFSGSFALPSIITL